MPALDVTRQWRSALLVMLCAIAAFCFDFLVDGQLELFPALIGALILVGVLVRGGPPAIVAGRYSWRFHAR